MGSPSELSLDYRPNGYSTAMKPFGDQADQTQKLEEFLARLEEERLKIEAFKRELPLCMQLLNNAMEAYRQQLEMYHNTNQGTRPLLEEFIPLKHSGTATEGVEKLPEGNGASSEKAGWMTSAQLWSPADGAMQAAAPQGNADTSFDVSPKAVLDNKQRHGGAFLPFTKERHSRGRPGVVPELALAPMEKEKSEKKLSDMEGARRESCGKVGHEQGKVVSNGASDGGGQAAAAAAQSHRKARRCWTPELHRRFVNALQMLGGSQVATPKQIRELMKVDGLTNDEVKSHLQKYRLHTRRPIPAPSAPASVAAPQLVVLGGIWVPPEYATTAAAGPVIYGGHAAAAAHFCAGPPVQHDFYSPPLQPTPYLPPQLQHDHGVAAAATAASGPAYKVKDESPLSDMRGRQERSESIEDGEEEVDGDDEVEEEEEEEEGRQSESSSWKEGDEKSLGSVVEDMHVSNKSTAVVLKF